MADNIEVQIVLDGKTYTAQLNQAEAESAKAGKKSGDGFEKGFSSSLSGLKTAFAGIAAGLIGAFSVKAIVSAASEQQNAINQFGASLAAVGGFSKQAVSDFTDYAEALQNTTGVADDLIQTNASLLVSVGGLTGQGLKDATKASLDLAAGLRIDVQSAFQLVAKAASGNTAALGRYGIKVNQAGTDSEKFASALDKIQSRFGGQAEAQLNTFSGGITALKNAFGNLLEELGGFIVRSPAITALFKAIVGGITSLTGSVKGLGAENKDVLRPMVLTFLDIAKAITYVVVPAVTVLSNWFKSMGALIGGVASVLYDAFSGDFAGALEGSKMVISEYMTNIMNLGQGVADNTVAAVGSINTVIATVTAASETLKPVYEDMKNGIAEVAYKFEAELKKINDAIQTFLIDSATNGIAAFGAALVKGGSAFKTFGKSLLGSLGDLAISIGKTILFSGIAIEALKKSLVAFTGVGAVVAGIALIAIGGALKALAGGSGGGGSSNSTGSAISQGSSGGAVQAAADSDVGQSRVERGPNVVVNVEGNILDRRQTGLELAEVISEAFGGQAVVFGA